MGFVTGIDAGREQDEREKFGPRNGPTYLRLKAGETVTFMVLHEGDQWLRAKTHNYVPSKVPGDKKGEFRSLSAICRRDDGIGADECYICDELHTRIPNEKTANAKRVTNRGRYFPQPRYYLPVVILEDVLGTQEMIDAGEIPATVKVGAREQSTVGRRVGRRVRMVEVEETDAEGNPTGKKVTRPDVQLWVAAPTGAVATLAEDWHDEDKGTVCRHPYNLKREGEGKDDTNYLLTAAQPVPELDFTDPAAREPYLEHLNVIELLERQGSAEFYAEVFDRRVQNEGDPVDGDGGDTSAPNVKLDDGQVEKLRKIQESMKKTPAAVGS